LPGGAVAHFFSENGMKNLSLLPYLNSRKGFYLDFLSATEDRDDPARDLYPFRVLDDSDPVARLIQADLCAVPGEIIKKVFVLVQKDRCLLPHDSLSTISNPDIDQAWQRAGSFYHEPGNDRSVVTLAHRAGEERGCVEPFQPLFFCKLHGLFFHPICPQCGLPLELCTDDERLISSGLAPFSRSLTRYLSCGSPECADQSGFYVYERLPGDYPRLKDCRDLVREFSTAPERAGELSGFPCHGCIARGECFGSGQSMRALERIVPFSFYPFYMFVFDAMTVNALQFSSMLSGATREQVKLNLRAEQAQGQAGWLKMSDGQEGKGFLFRDDPRFFAEVLYLKLSLLSELIRVVPDDEFPSETGFKSSLDRIWVKVSEQNSLLPAFWTFTVHPLDIFRSFPGSLTAHKLIKRANPYYLAVIWFSVLAVNERRSVADVSREIKESIINDALSSGLPADRVDGQTDLPCAFLPSDIFWNQSEDPGVIIRESYLEVWERTMDLGRSLLAAAMQEDRSWSTELFLKEVDAFRAEIYEELFAPALTVYQHVGAGRADDGLVRHILDGNVARWRLGTEQEPQAAPPEGAPPSLDESIDEEEESLETIIVGPTRPGTITNPAAAPVADDLEETVIISASGAKDMVASSNRDKGLGSEILEETVIISRRTEAGDSQAPAVPAEEDLEATLIMGRPKPGPGEKG
jgi:hypothetical protein